MALTDRAQRLVVLAGGKAKTAKNNLADPGKRAAYMEVGRTAVSQGTAFVTDKTATMRSFVGKQTPVVVGKAKQAGTRSVELVQTHGPKVTQPARKLSRKVTKTSQEKAPVAKNFASRNRDEIFLVLAVVEVIIHFRKVLRKRRGNKK